MAIKVIKMITPQTRILEIKEHIAKRQAEASRIFDEIDFWYGIIEKVEKEMETDKK